MSYRKTRICAQCNLALPKAFRHPFARRAPRTARCDFCGIRKTVWLIWPIRRRTAWEELARAAALALHTLFTPLGPRFYCPEDATEFDFEYQALCEARKKP